VKAPRRATVAENWPLPVVVVAHHAAADGHPDAYPLLVASKILSDGQNARIYRRLVYDTGIALAAAGVANLLEDPALFYAYAIVQPGHTAAEAERALVQELDRLRTEPVPDRELESREEAVHARLRVRAGDDPAKGERAGHASVLHRGDAGSADAEYELFQAVTARGRPARGARLLRAGDPPRDHGGAETGDGRPAVTRRRAGALALAAGALLAASAPSPAQVRKLAVGADAAAAGLAAGGVSRPTRCAPSRTASGSWPSRTTSSRW